MTPESPKSPLDRLLGLGADVHAGEGSKALLLALNSFLLLAAYYSIRPLRSALLLPVELRVGDTVLPGPEITAYLGAILAGLFLGIVPMYGALASRVTRIRLINTVTTFFIVTLLVFFLATGSHANPTAVGISYYLWLGVFSLMVIAQFWSFANDLYTPEQGKRLFAIVGFGGSLGAVAGALITSQLISRLGTTSMMLVGAGILTLAVLLTNVIHLRDHRQRTAAASAGGGGNESIGATGGGFRLVLGSRYLLAIGLLTLTVQIVNTNGNYILNATVERMASVAAQSGGLTEEQIIGSYMAGIDFWQNVLSMLIQFFVVSRVFKYLGIGGALFVLPVIALGSYSLFALAPILSLIRVAKIAENATDYSLQNTVRRALFLPTSREAKYKALQAVETFFWRAGDMLSGVATFVIVQWLALSVQAYAGLNIAIVAVWLGIAAFLARENKKLTAEPERLAA